MGSRTAVVFAFRFFFLDDFSLFFDIVMDDSPRTDSGFGIGSSLRRCLHLNWSFFTFFFVSKDVFTDVFSFGEVESGTVGVDLFDFNLDSDTLLLSCSPTLNCNVSSTFPAVLVISTFRPIDFDRGWDTTGDETSTVWVDAVSCSC